MKLWTAESSGSRFALTFKLWTPLEHFSMLALPFCFSEHTKHTKHAPVSSNYQTESLRDCCRRCVGLGVLSTPSGGLYHAQRSNNPEIPTMDTLYECTARRGNHARRPLDSIRLLMDLRPVSSSDECDAHHRPHRSHTTDRGSCARTSPVRTDFEAMMPERFTPRVAFRDGCQTSVRAHHRVGSILEPTN